MANFIVSPTSGVAPLTLSFTSTSGGAIDSYNWNFGDGETSSVMNPIHTYFNGGTYSATLTVIGPGGADVETRTIMVSDPPPVASFTVSKTSGDVPLTVNFTSTSNGNITSYSWTFGDGGTSGSMNPSHTYNSDGTFTARLTVTGPGGSSSASKTITAEDPGTDVKFYNPTYTDITVTLNSQTKEIPVGDYVEFSGVEGSSKYFSAYTYGKTTGGTQVGLKLEWGGTLTLSGGTQTNTLDVSDDYFFLYVTNNSSYVLQTVYVNYGLNSQTVDNVVLNNTGTRYRIGYYKAWTNSNVRIYLKDQPSSYYHWEYGTHFTLPWTVNQSASLATSSEKSVITSTDVNAMATTGSGELLIPLAIDHSKTPAMNKADPKAIHLYSK